MAAATVARAQDAGRATDADAAVEGTPGDDALAVADDRAADRALGAPDDDAPDAVADEGERTGSAEGEPLPDGAPAVASEIAALGDRACLRALERAHVPFERVHHAVAGIGLPVHVTGPIAGVTYHASDRREIHELMDCRLAVALVRFSHLVSALGIVDVRHFSTYRPPDRRAVERRPLMDRHFGGMAIDAAWFRRADGAVFVVDRDFHGRLGREPCGPDARVPPGEAPRVLRSIACDAARRGIFHVILTPDFNRPHHNHFHLEVARGTSWRFVR